MHISSKKKKNLKRKIILIYLPISFISINIQDYVKEGIIEACLKRTSCTAVMLPCYRYCILRGAGAALLNK